MEIPVLVEPSPAGFRAATGAPLGLTADGPTADAALAALRALITERFRAGAQLHVISVNGPRGPLTAAGVEAILNFIREHPLSHEHLRVVEEYRRVHNTVPDPNEPIFPEQGLADNPLFDDWLRAVEDYRREKDAAERAAGSERSG